MGNIKIIRNKHTFRADTGKEYIWVAYVMGSSKAYTTPDKKKEKTFGQFGSVAREFEIMIFAPDDKTLEKKNHLGMLIIRVDNKGRIIEDEVDKSNVTPKILKVDHRKMGDGDPNKVSYQDTLLVWAETQGLQNKEITFKLLWNNDDEPKKVFKAKVDNKDRAEVKIPLITYPDVLDAFIKNKTSKDKSTERTFKVEASFGEPPKTNGKKATQVKGEIKDAYFIDKNGEKVTKLKKGDVVRVCIESEGMINKSFQYFILEKDKYTPDDAITSSGVLTFKDDIFIGREIEIDDEKLLWGGKEREGEDRKEQNYTIEVKTFSDSKGSKPFQITTEDLKVEYGISAVKVTTGEVNKNTKTPPADGLFLPDIQIKEVYEVKDDKNVSLEPDKEADKHIKVLDEKTSVATEYKEKDITTIKQTNSMIIRFSVTPKGGKKVGYLGLFLSTSHEAEILYANELYYNYKNVLSPNIASITIKEGEKERTFGSGYTTKINGKETEFELKIVFNEDKKINRDVFIDIFSNTNAALAKPTLSGSALHRFKMKLNNSEWHDPVDNPRRTKYNSKGNIKPINGAYGDVRNNYTKYHSGLDLFALPYIKNEYRGTPVYACLSGEVVESVPGNNAGQTIRIKIDNVKDLLKQEKSVNYQLEFAKGEEKGIDIKETDDVYLIYMHLSERIVKAKDKVNAGDIIGYSGVSGSIANDIPSPHLHFEIATVKNAYGKGKSVRTNPARFIRLNSYNTEDQDEAVNFRYKQDGTKTKWTPPKANYTKL